MNVKKLLSTALLVVCVSFTMPAISNPLAPETSIADPALTEKGVDPMVRLREIKDMDKTNLTRAEKKELRKEVKEMRKEVRANKNGIYLSIGAIAIIVLLLILLL